MRFKLFSLKSFLRFRKSMHTKKFHTKVIENVILYENGPNCSYRTNMFQPKNSVPKRLQEYSK